MRGTAVVLGLLTACAGQEPLGVYRFPMQTGEREVSLRTLFVELDRDDLVMVDASSGEEVARGQTTSHVWSDEARPYRFKKSPGFPLELYLRDGVLEDTKPRPYAKAPIAALASRVDAVRRVVLRSGVEREELLVAGGHVLAAGAREQPALTELPGPLAAMGSVAGGGLWLPPSLAADKTWADPMSTAVPPDPALPLPCGAPLRSVWRVLGVEGVDVPAGRFDAWHVVEIVTACKQPKPAEVRLYQVDRWFVPGLGPVKITYDASDAKRRTYLLSQTTVTSSANRSLWPFEPGHAWTFDLFGPDDVPAGTQELRVESVEVVELP